MLAPGGAFGLVVLLWFAFLFFATTFLVWTLVKGTRGWASGDRTSRNNARIWAPLLVAGVTASLMFLSLGGGWRASRALDDVMASSITFETAERRSRGGALGCRSFSIHVEVSESTSWPEAAEHDAQVLEDAGWSVDRFVPGPSTPADNWAFVATRNGTQVQFLPGVYHLEESCELGIQFFGNESRWTLVPSYPSTS